MMHGTFTNVGGSFDVHMISIIAYLAHQISTQNIPCEGDCNPSILKELSLTKRNITSVEFSNKLTQDFIDLPVPEWSNILEHGDYPKSLFLNFGCLVSSVCNVLLPEMVADKVVGFLAHNLITAEDADFVYNHYNP